MTKFLTTKLITILFIAVSLVMLYIFKNKNKNKIETFSNSSIAFDDLKSENSDVLKNPEFLFVNNDSFREPKYDDDGNKISEKDRFAEQKVRAYRISSGSYGFKYDEIKQNYPEITTDNYKIKNEQLVPVLWQVAKNTNDIIGRMEINLEKAEKNLNDMTNKMKTINEEVNLMKPSCIQKYRQENAFK